MQHGGAGTEKRPICKNCREAENDPTTHLAQLILSISISKSTKFKKKSSYFFLLQKVSFCLKKLLKVEKIWLLQSRMSLHFLIWRTMLLTRLDTS